MHKNHKNTFFSNTHKNVVCDFFFSTHHIKLSMTAQEHKCTTKGVKSFLVCSHRASLSSLQCLFTDTETKFYQSVPRKTKWEFNKKQETAQQQKKRNLLGTAGPLGYFLHCWSVLNGATSSIWTSSSSHRDSVYHRHHLKRASVCSEWTVPSAVRGTEKSADFPLLQNTDFVHWWSNSGLKCEPCDDRLMLKCFCTCKTDNNSWGVIRFGIAWI